MLRFLIELTAALVVYAFEFVKERIPKVLEKFKRKKKARSGDEESQGVINDGGNSNGNEKSAKVVSGEVKDNSPE